MILPSQGHTMATILDFRSTGTSQSRGQHKAGNSPASAELIFFPGVRYERAQDAEPVRRKRKRPTRPHDQIELQD